VTDTSTPETVIARRGPRSGQMITVSIDSTALGPALGGCRVRRYPRWQDGLADAVRLSAAMTEKAALAGLAHGGGKTVVSLDGSPVTREDLLADVGDLVESFGGGYVTGPDIGTGPADMAAIGRRTPHVLCRPETAGGSGDSSRPTAIGVLAALDAVCAHRWPGRDLSTLTVAVHGLGHVGARVGARLAEAGAALVVSDVDGSKRGLADSWGATWVDPDEALVADADLLLPCATGGILTAGIVPELRCTAIVGAANNQLDGPATADLLHARGILWAPDTVVSAGGIVAAVSLEREGATPSKADDRVRGIQVRLAAILRAAEKAGTTPQREASRQAREAVGVSR
jgi:glutamate dehydrogenase/leucine dehydrogenase